MWTIWRERNGRIELSMIVIRYVFLDSLNVWMTVLDSTLFIYFKELIKKVFVFLPFFINIFLICPVLHSVCFNSECFWNFFSSRKPSSFCLFGLTLKMSWKMFYVVWNAQKSVIFLVIHNNYANEL